MNRMSKMDSPKEVLWHCLFTSLDGLFAEEDHYFLDEPPQTYWRPIKGTPPSSRMYSKDKIYRFSWGQYISYRETHGTA